MTYVAQNYIPQGRHGLPILKMLLEIPKTDCSARNLENNNGFDGTRRMSSMDSEASYALWFCIACA
jgi:hypothetical protein